jgi:hypothetical protein
MPKVHRRTDWTVGEDCWVPQQPQEWSPNTFGTGGLNVVRYGDKRIPHICPSIPETHGAIYIGHKCEVFVNEQYIQLIGDPLSCGDTVATGDPKWDCCSEAMPMLKPKITVAPEVIDFGKRLVGVESSGPVDIGGILESITLPFIPITITNTGGSNLIIQYSKYGPINPGDNVIPCNPSGIIAGPEYPDFLFKGHCMPVVLKSSETTVFYVNFVPESAGIKTMYIDIYSAPDQEVQQVTLKGEGIGIPSLP